MTQAKLKFASFADYLAWSNDPANYLEGRFELVDGELVEVPPESGVNRTIANRLLFLVGCRWCGAFRTGSFGAM